MDILPAPSKMLASISWTLRRPNKEAIADLRESVSRRLVQPGVWDFLARALFLVYLVLIVLTFRDYGITWDEYWHSTYGHHILTWYATLFRDTHALEYWELIYYGGFFTTIAQAVAEFSPLGIFETRHLIGALFGLCGVVGAYKLGKYLVGPFAGFLAALVLVLTPSFYGHAFTNAVDVPFASLFVVSVYFIVVSIHSFPHIPMSLLLKLGIAIGLAMGVRVVGIVLMGYLFLAFGLCTARQYFLRSGLISPMAHFRSTLLAFGWRYLVVGVIAYIVMLVWWPWALVRPLTRPLRALILSSHYHWPMSVFFEGKPIAATELPWYYLAKSFLITLPEFYVIALGAGLVLTVLVMIRRESHHNKHLIEYSLLIISIVLPLVLQAVSHAVVYDSTRHFLFILPMLAVLAAISIAEIMRRPRLRLVAAISVAMIVVSMMATIVDMAQLHPDEYIFFNHVFGGGLQQASQSFETDYWGNSYKEGVEWIAKNYDVRPDGEKIKVASCSFPLSTEYFLPKDKFQYVGSYDYGASERPTLFLATTRWDCGQKLEGRIVHVVMRQGTPLLYIKETSGNQ